CYITADEFCARCTRTMETLDRLERYEGHLLNWYNTKSLEPLNPRYVSTVDSGNLIASLWVLQQGCNDVVHAPILSRTGMRGLRDTLSILEERCGDDPSAGVAVRALRRLMHGAKQGHELIARYRMASVPMQRLREAQRWHVAATDERSYWTERLSSELSSWTGCADRYLRWMEILASPPDSLLRAIGDDAVRLRRKALHDVPSLETLGGSDATAVDSILAWRGSREMRPGLASWLDELAEEYRTARTNAAETMKAIRALSANAAKLAD